MQTSNTVLGLGTARQSSIFGNSTDKSRCQKFLDFQLSHQAVMDDLMQDYQRHPGHPFVRDAENFVKNKQFVYLRGLFKYVLGVLSLFVGLVWFHVLLIPAWWVFASMGTFVAIATYIFICERTDKQLEVNTKPLFQFLDDIDDMLESAPAMRGLFSSNFVKKEPNGVDGITVEESGDVIEDAAYIDLVGIALRIVADCSTSTISNVLPEMKLLPDEGEVMLPEGVSSGNSLIFGTSPSSSLVEQFEKYEVMCALFGFKTICYDDALGKAREICAAWAKPEGSSSMHIEKRHVE
jgi:hypothetical protein